MGKNISSVLLLGMALALAACGGDDKKASQSGAAGAGAGAAGSGGAGSGGGAGAPTDDPTVEVQGEFDDLAVASKCDEKKRTNCLEPSENAVRIDDEVKARWKNVEFDGEKDSLSFDLEPGATLDPRIKEGAVLYRGRKDKKPMMHRVEALKVEGSRVSMKLKKAKPKEVFNKGNVRMRAYVGEPEEKGAAAPPGSKLQNLNEPLGTLQQPLSFTVGPQNCAGTVVDGAYVDPNGAGYATVKLTLDQCRLRLSAWVDVVLQWDNKFTNLDKFEVVVGGSVDAALEATLTATTFGSIGASYTIWSLPTLPPISLGGIQFTVTPSLNAGWDMSAAAVLTANQGFTYTGSIEEGFGWSDTLGWYTVDQKTSNFTKIGPNITFDGNVKATAYLKPKLEVQLYGIVGGYVALKGFVEGNITSTAQVSGGNASGQVCIDLVAGATPSVGASCDLLGITLFDEEAYLPTSRVNIANDVCVDYTGPIPSDCDAAASDCCIDGQCPTEDFVDGTVRQCVKGDATSGGKFKYFCKTEFPPGYCIVEPSAGKGCDDGKDYTIDECVDNWCQHTTLKEKYKPDTPDVVEPVEVCFNVNGECCETSADCLDGDSKTIDVCDKDITVTETNNPNTPIPKGGVNLSPKGMCVHTPIGGGGLGSGAP